MNTESFAGVVLAGGASSRMGTPKHLIQMEGIPLWKRQVDLLKNLDADPVALSLGPSQPFEETACPVLRDKSLNMGPLGGIAEALAWSPHPWVLVLAVDLVSMDQVTLEALTPHAGTREGCVPRLDGRIEPLAALYPITALRIAQRHLACGRLAACAFAEACVEEKLVRWLDLEARQSAPFRNANRPEDLADRSAYSRP